MEFKKVEFDLLIVDQAGDDRLVKREGYHVTDTTIPAYCEWIVHRPYEWNFVGTQHITADDDWCISDARCGLPIPRVKVKPRATRQAAVEEAVALMKEIGAVKYKTALKKALKRYKAADTQEVTFLGSR